MHIDKKTKVMEKHHNKELLPTLVYIYIYLRKESNMSLKARPKGQTEQNEKWQEEQTPSKPLMEKKI